jgi:hypothetical protein
MPKLLRAAALYFALVFGAGFLLGTIRVPFLVPRLGVRTAELLETPVMLVVMFFASRHVARRFALSPRAFMAVGLVALLLVLAAEGAVAMAFSDLSLRQYVASRDPISGPVYLASLLLFAALPYYQARRARSNS